MKSPISKLFTMMLILSAFALQASSPRVPPVTVLTITDIPTGYYAMQVKFHGYEVDTYNEYTDWEIVYSPSGTGLFYADHKFIHVDETIWMTVTVYYKQYSYSPWTWLGTVASFDPDMTKSLDDDFLYHADLSYNDLYAE